MQVVVVPVVVVPIVLVVAIAVVVITEVFKYDLVMKISTRVTWQLQSRSPAHLQQRDRIWASTWEYVRVDEGFTDRPTPVPPVL